MGGRQARGAPEHAGDGRKLGQVKRLERENLAKADGRGRAGRWSAAGPDSQVEGSRRATSPAPSPRTQAEPPAAGSEPVVVPEAAPVPAPKSTGPGKLTLSP